MRGVVATAGNEGTALRVGIVSAALVLAGCCWQHPRDALSSAPDHQCSTGSTHGFDIAVWDCVDDERVVAWRSSSEMMCSGVEVERGPCGAPTAFERDLGDADRQECAGAVLGPPADGS